MENSDIKPSATTGAAAQDQDVTDESSKTRSREESDTIRSHEGGDAAQVNTETGTKLDTMESKDGIGDDHKKKDNGVRNVHPSSSNGRAHNRHNTKASQIPVAVSRRQAAPERNFIKTKIIYVREHKSMPEKVSRIPRPITKSLGCHSQDKNKEKGDVTVTHRKSETTVSKIESDIDTPGKGGCLSASCQDEEAAVLEAKLDLSFLDSAPNSPETEHILAPISQTSTDTSSSSGSSVKSRPAEMRSSKLGKHLRRFWKSLKKMCCCCCKRTEECC